MATPYTFTENSILKGKKVVMHNWETPVMERMARFVCSGGWAERNDILEIGFGMGIASNFIQQYNPTSHTICEIDPEVIQRLEEWASDKPNVKIVKGDWYKNIDNFGKYDGILFDTFDDSNLFYFVEEFIYEISKKDTKFTIWHWTRHDKIPYENVETEKIEINPPDIDYHHGDYFMLHRITING